MQNMSNRYAQMLVFCVLAIGALAAPDAFAQVNSGGQTAGQIAQNVTTSLSDVSILGEAVAYIAGFFLGLGALFKFKAYRDNPQQTPLGTPLTWLGVAIFLIFLPELFGTGAQTLLGGEGTQVTPW